MFEGPAKILGGLPVIAEVWFTRGDGWTTDDDAGVTALYWTRRDGTKGKPVPQKIYDRCEKTNPFWESEVADQVGEYLAFEDWCAKNPEEAKRHLADFGAE